VNGVRRNFARIACSSLLAALILLGAYATYARRLEGWGSQTHLKELFPWGLCAGLDVFCGLALAVGGFTIVATLYLAGFEFYRPILRVAMLIGFLGFVVAVLATVANRPFRPWAIAALWSPWSRFLGLGLALVFYSALLFLEWVPAMSQRAALRPLVTMLAILCAFLSASQQSTFAKLLTITPNGFSPLWVTPMLPAQLYLSSIGACLALVLLVVGNASMSKPRTLPPVLSEEVAKALGVVVPLYVAVRGLDLFDSRAFPLLFQSHRYNYLLGIELSLFLIPALILIRSREGSSLQKLNTTALLVIAGFVINRMNTSITAREAVVGTLYVPGWFDMTIACGAIAVGLALFGLASQHLPVFQMPGADTPDRATLPFPLRQGPVPSLTAFRKR
jgi:Ni/Fe-hydrogenase subunit HybB-like protein